MPTPTLQCEGAAVFQPPCLFVPPASLHLQQRDRFHPGTPEPCQSLRGAWLGDWGPPLLSEGGLGKASPALGRWPTCSKDCAPFCTTSGPMASAPQGAGGLRAGAFQAGGSSKQKGSKWRCNPYLKYCTQVGRCSGSQTGTSLSPTSGLFQDRGKWGSSGCSAAGGSRVTAIPYGMFWEILLTPG